MGKEEKEQWKMENEKGKGNRVHSREKQDKSQKKYGKKMNKKEG